MDKTNNIDKSNNLADMTFEEYLQQNQSLELYDFFKQIKQQEEEKNKLMESIQQERRHKIAEQETMTDLEKKIYYDDMYNDVSQFNKKLRELQPQIFTSDDGDKQQ